MFFSPLIEISTATFDMPLKLNRYDEFIDIGVFEGSEGVRTCAEVIQKESRTLQEW